MAWLLQRSRAVDIAECAHCHTPVIDYSSAVDLLTEIYCCQNCVAASRAKRTPVAPDVPVCDHCDNPLVEVETLVERAGQRFCCYNCAVAMTRDPRQEMAFVG